MVRSPCDILGAFAILCVYDDPNSIDAYVALEDASDDTYHQIEILYEVSRQIFRLRTTHFLIKNPNGKTKVDEQKKKKIRTYVNI